VIVIDDIGLLPVAVETAEALYRVVDAACEKRSVALSSNLHPAGFDELMPRPSPTPPSIGYCPTRSWHRKRPWVGERWKCITDPARRVGFPDGHV